MINKIKEEIEFIENNSGLEREDKRVIACLEQCLKWAKELESKLKRKNEEGMNSMSNGFIKEAFHEKEEVRG